MECDLQTIAFRLPRVSGCRGKFSALFFLFFFALSCCLNSAQSAQTQQSTQDKTPNDATSATAHADHPAAQNAHLDRSGKTRKGKVSYYGHNFYRKKMADGTPMDPQSDAAASKTLPIGTKARVTNLKNGNTAEVEIRDRGPYVGGRIVDVTPKTADKLGLKEDGTAPVEVKPVEVPQPDGTMKPGTGATDAPRAQ
jgi:rare lipoprotein A